MASTTNVPKIVSTSTHTSSVRSEVIGSTRNPGLKTKSSESNANFQEKAKIEDQMNNENLKMLQQIFEKADADDGGGLDIEEFEEAMKMAFGTSIDLDDQQLKLMFMKVDTNCDGTVDWEEFCSYMLLENQQKDSMTRDVIDLPFPNPAREIPNPHHDSLAKITYFPSIGITQRASSTSEGEELDNGNGRYITCSKDGVFVFWGLDLHIQRTYNLNDIQSSSSKSKQIWVTDIVCLANVKKVAVATTERDITFYDCSANNFEKQFILTGLEHCVLCLDYWYSLHNVNQSVLVLGDAGGGVSCISFKQATVGLFDANIGKQKNISTSTVRKIPFQELCCGRHPAVSAVLFRNLHDDWVRKVKYIPSLQCFISCANTRQTSLLLGDLQSKKMKSYFRIRKGVYSFDYDKENNIIVTGGLDRYIRLWNPYVTNKATSVLKGHNSSVVHIIAHADQIISFSKDKMVKIWDTRNHCCIQTIPSRLTDIGKHPVTTVLYNKKMQTLLLGSNTIAVLEKKTPKKTTITEDDTTTHPKPLCGALYNSLFNQVVSACHGSVVNVWHVDTGDKAIMFTNAHDGNEITAMSFDPTKRRLITGSRNGTVKVWNFNNGSCLQEMNAIDDGEVTEIVCPKQQIVTVGWNHKITTYRDVRGAEDDPPKTWNSLHKDDILSADYTKPGLMATASYDGQVICWNIETGHIFCQMNVNRTFRKRSKSLADTTSFNRNRPEGWSNRCRTTQDLHPDDINKHLSVDRVMFLQNREPHKETATLLVSVDGVLQAWSVHGGLLGQFDVTGRRNDESVLAMHGNTSNEVLFTGDSLGYIKIWDISTYCIKANKTNLVIRSPSSPLSQFSKRKQTMEEGESTNPFKKPTLADSSKESSPSSSCSSNKTDAVYFDTFCTPPECLTSFRGHGKSIVTIDYCESKQLIVTASTDCYVRLWTIDGKYIGTFGQKQPWDSLENPASLKKSRRLPADIQRIASKQTLKILNGAASRQHKTKNIFAVLHLGKRLARGNVKNDGEENALHEIDDETAALSRPHVLDISLDNILGKNYKPKQRHRMPPKIKQKINNMQCVAFSSLPFKELEPVAEPKMPPVLVQAIAERQQQQRTLQSPQNGENMHGRKTTFWRKGGSSPMRQVMMNRILPMITFRK